MTALGWIVVLGPVGAYAVLWLVCWRAMKKGPQEWLGTEHDQRSRSSSTDGAATAIRVEVTPHVRPQLEEMDKLAEADNRSVSPYANSILEMHVDSADANRQIYSDRHR
jgi:hypothetical protein